MLLLVVFKCTSTGETGKSRLELNNEEHSTVRDLKLEIQRTFKVPVCDQRVYFQDRLLGCDTLQMAELYFRENDELYLEFLARAEIDTLDAEIHIIKNFYLRVAKFLDSPTFRSFCGLANMTFFSAIEGVKFALGRIGYHYFTPWKEGRALAHRHYFVQEGGFDAFLGVFKFSQVAFHDPSAYESEGDKTQKTSAANDADELSDDDDDVEFNIDADNPNPELSILQLLSLQTCCLGLLWNFLETAPDRQLGYQKGGLSLAIESLMVDPRTAEMHSSSVDAFWQRVSINEEAIGCVAGFVEHNTGAQRLVASNKALVNKVLEMLIDGEYYGTFYRQLAINLLFYCSFDAVALHDLAKQNVHLKVMQFLKRHLEEEDTNDIVFRYYSSVFLARARTSQRFSLSPRIATYVDNVLINGFLTNHTPDEIADWEDEHSYVWITLKPLVHLAFAGGKPSKRAEEGRKIISHETNADEYYTERQEDNMCEVLDVIENFGFGNVIELGNAVAVIKHRADDDDAEDNDDDDDDNGNNNVIVVHDGSHNVDQNPSDSGHDAAEEVHYAAAFDDDNNDDAVNGDGDDDDDDDNMIIINDKVDKSPSHSSHPGLGEMDSDAGNSEKLDAGNDLSVSDAQDLNGDCNVNLTSTQAENVVDSLTTDLSTENQTLDRHNTSNVCMRNEAADANDEDGEMHEDLLCTADNPSTSAHAQSGCPDISVNTTSLECHPLRSVGDEEVGSSVPIESDSTMAQDQPGPSGVNTYGDGYSLSSDLQMEALFGAASRANNPTSGDDAIAGHHRHVVHVCELETDLACGCCNENINDEQMNERDESDDVNDDNSADDPMMMQSNQARPEDDDDDISDLDDKNIKHLKRLKKILERSKVEDKDFLKIFPFAPPLVEGYDMFSLVQQGESNPAMKWPGSLAVQRLGIFSIQHLLFSEGNRELILTENLLDYLICLQWQLREEERNILRSERTEKFNPTRPPTLRIMAKSVLAQVYGFDAISRF